MAVSEWVTPPLASDPMAINVVSQILALEFGEDGWMLLSRRNGVAIQILNAVTGIIAARDTIAKMNTGGET